MQTKMGLGLAALAAGTAIGLSASYLIGPANAAADALLTGVIKSATGEIIGGVTVSAKAEDGNITHSVFTDENGNYYFPPLPAGKYRIWAQALGYQIAKSEVDLANVKHQDFMLATITDFDAKVRQAPGEVLLNALPDKTRDDARMKQLVRDECTGCHTPSFPLQFKFDQAGWSAILNLMEHINVNGVYQGPDRVAQQIVNFHHDELAAYLARARGPGQSSLNIVYPERPSGEAARVYWKEYDVPLDPDANLPDYFVQNDGGDWTLGTPSKIVPGYGTHDAVIDYNHNIWFTSSLPNKRTTIGRIDAKTGEVKTFRLDGPQGLAGSTHGIIRDAKGMLWFNVTTATKGSLAQVDPNTQVIKVFAPPANMGAAGGSLDFDGQGKIWISSRDGVLRFDPDTATWQQYKSLVFKTVHGEHTTYGVAADRNGNGWWAQMASDTIGFADSKTGKAEAVALDPVPGQMELITEAEKKFYETTPTDYNQMVPWAEGPRRMGSDKNGDTVWIGDSFGANFARININTHAVSYVPLPDNMQPYHTTIDSQHNVWGNIWTTDRVGRYNPTTGKWTIFDMPSRGTETRYVDVLERDGRTEVVLPSYRLKKMSLMTIRTPEDIAALKKQAQ